MGHLFIYPAVLQLPRGMLYFKSYSFTIRRGHPSPENPLMNSHFLQGEGQTPELGKPSRLGWPGCPAMLDFWEARELDCVFHLLAATSVPVP